MKKYKLTAEQEKVVKEKQYFYYYTKEDEDWSFIQCNYLVMSLEGKCTISVMKDYDDNSDGLTAEILKSMEEEYNFLDTIRIQLINK